MGIFAVLMILEYADLQQKGTQYGTLAPVDDVLSAVVLLILLLDGPDSAEVDVMPAVRLIERHLGEVLNVVHAHARKELDLGWGVGLVILEVQENLD